MDLLELFQILCYREQSVEFLYRQFKFQSQLPINGICQKSGNYAEEIICVIIINFTKKEFVIVAERLKIMLE